MADDVNVFDTAVRQKDSDFHVVIRLFTDCSISCLLPLGSILRMSAQQPFFPGRQALFWIEAIYAIPFLGEMQGVPSRYPPGPTPRVRKPLRFRQITFAPPQCFFRALAVLDIKGGCIPLHRFPCFVTKRHSAKQVRAIDSVEPAHACFALPWLTGHQHRFPLIRKLRKIFGMDYRLPVRTVPIGLRTRGHFHHISTVQCRLQRKPEIIQPTFIYVIKVTVRTKSVYHRGGWVPHEPKTLFRKSFTSPEFLFRTLTVADVHHSSDELDAARFIT